MGPLSLDWETYAVPASAPLEGCKDVSTIEGGRRLPMLAFNDFQLYTSGHESAASVARSVQVLCWLCQEISSVVSLSEHATSALPE